MKQIKWDAEKNNLLKKERNVSFELVSKKIMDGDIITTLTHPNQNKYSNQKIFVMEINNYPYIVPFVEEMEYIFFKNNNS
jgi:uncharacterized DUF497 family protein